MCRWRQLFCLQHRVNSATTQTLTLGTSFRHTVPSSTVSTTPALLQIAIKVNPKWIQHKGHTSIASPRLMIVWTCIEHAISRKCSVRCKVECQSQSPLTVCLPAMFFSDRVLKNVVSRHVPWSERTFSDRPCLLPFCLLVCSESWSVAKTDTNEPA